MNKEAARQMVEEVRQAGRTALSEYEAKQVLAAYEIPVPAEMLVAGPDELEAAVEKIGWPLVMKGCAAEIAHKTEKNLIRVDIRDLDEARQALAEIMAGLGDAAGSVLVQEMVPGRRELAVGMSRDAQFGVCVMFGLGGILTEILEDVVFGKAPLSRTEARQMLGEIRGHRILEAIRGMAAADVDQLAGILVQVGQIGLDMDMVAEIDINPVIISGSRPVAVDALVVLRPPATE